MALCNICIARIYVGYAGDRAMQGAIAEAMHEAITDATLLCPMGKLNLHF
ncbi:MAG: hypothetical protein Q7U66_01750 [Methylobacter sp.]|nr:hypothetical protein [Methylobacter sp.]